MTLEDEISVIKDVPGYQTILKSVLKSQIQLLVQQLSEYGEEECCVMTACLNDGTLTHLGSTFGKGFLDSRMDLKSQFFSHCLSSRQTFQKTRVPVVLSVMPPNISKKLSTRQRYAPYILPKQPGQSSSLPSTLSDDKNNSSKKLGKRKNANVNQSDSSEETGSAEINMENQSASDQDACIEDEESNTNTVMQIENGSEIVIMKQEPVDSDFPLACTEGELGIYEPVTVDIQGPGSSLLEKQEAAKNHSCQVDKQTFKKTRLPVVSSVMPPNKSKKSSTRQRHILLKQPDQPSPLSPTLFIDAENNLRKQLKIGKIENVNHSNSSEETGSAEINMENQSALYQNVCIDDEKSNANTVVQIENGSEIVIVKQEPLDSDFPLACTEGESSICRPVTLAIQGPGCSLLVKQEAAKNHLCQETKEMKQKTSEDSYQNNDHLYSLTEDSKHVETEKQIDLAVKLLKAYMRKEEYGHTDFEILPAAELDSLLQHFYPSLRTKDSQKYSRTVLYGIRAGLNHYLTSPPVSRPICLKTGIDFYGSNLVLQGL